jgi:small subunit ribosomal protein S8
MPLSDPIGDLLTRMRNAQHGRRNQCRAQWSKIKVALCEVLKNHGYIETVGVEGEGKDREVVVTFKADRPALILKRISTPGSRMYVGAGEIRMKLHGNSIAVISTSAGLLTDKEAREKNIGGEILCTVS